MLINSVAATLKGWFKKDNEVTSGLRVCALMGLEISVNALVRQMVVCMLSICHLGSNHLAKI